MCGIGGVSGVGLVGWVILFLFLLRGIAAGSSKALQYFVTNTGGRRYTICMLTKVTGLSPGSESSPTVL